MAEAKLTKSEVPTYLSVGKILTYAMYALIIFAEIVLVFRVFLLAFSANPDSGFTRFIYNTSADFLEPFRGIFPPRPVGETGYLDVSALFAVIVYGLLAWGFAALIGYINTKISQYNK
jgi:uncharacterized protein YggT (Ycf19 family)